MVKNNFKIIESESPININNIKIPSDDKTVIVFETVNKHYRLYKNDKQRFLGLFMKKRIKYKEFEALRDVSFTIKKGECVGVLGRNGAGKSTMLKIITGVCYPTSGTVLVNGQVSALLELTAGFDQEMTGRENIYLRGYIMGLHKDKIRELEDTIIKFAELEDFIDQPLRTYSSGMRARLGFAVNANIDPDILVIDEALSVGDARFSKKCKKKVDEIIRQGATVLFVSHSTAAIRDFCTRCLVLDKGKLVYEGDVDSAIAQYEANYS